jgi:hypothetical protein
VNDRGLAIGDRYRPMYWYFGFTEKTSRWWMRALPGRFKHVVAFTPLVSQGVWIVIDAGFDQTEIAVIPDGEADAMLGWLSEMQVIRMPVRARATLPRFGYWCTALCGHLAGISPCALLPSGFYRQCLAQGGVLIDGRNETTETGAQRTRARSRDSPQRPGTDHAAGFEPGDG